MVTVLKEGKMEKEIIKEELMRLTHCTLEREIKKMKEKSCLCFKTQWNRNEGTITRKSGL